MKLHRLLPALLAGPLAATGPAQEPPRDDRPMLINRLVAIVNDQVLTQAQVDRMALMEAIRRRNQGEEVGQVEIAQLRRQATFQQVLGMLFREGFRMEGLNEELVDRIVEDEIERQVEQAGSLAAHAQLVLKTTGMTLDQHRNRLKQVYSTLLYQEVTQGRMPAKGRTSFKARVHVRPADVEAYYREHLEDFDQQYRVAARMILIKEEEGQPPARERLEALADRIRSGRISFADAAREYSAFRASTGGSLGRVNPETSPTVRGYHENVKAFLRAGRVGLSPPLEVTGGWVLVQVEEVQEPGVRPLEEVELEIRARLLASQQEALIREAVNHLRERCYVWGEGIDELLDEAFQEEPGTLSEAAK